MENVLDRIKAILDADRDAGEDYPVDVFGRTGDNRTGNTRVLSVSWNGEDYEITAKKVGK